MYSHEAAKVELSLGQFESSADFANQVGFFLLNVGKELFKSEEYVFISLDVEFFNNDTHIITAYDYPEGNDLSEFEEIFEKLKSTGIEYFVLKVVYEEETD